MSHPDGPTTEVLSEPSRRRRESQRVGRGRHFIKGPVPMPWLEQAAGLPGKALAVGLLLWFIRGIVGDRPIAVSGGLLRRFNVGRKAAGRALTALEQAGLIRADRASGRLARARVISDHSPEGSETHATLSSVKLGGLQ